MWANVRKRIIKYNQPDFIPKTEILYFDDRKTIWENPARIHETEARKRPKFVSQQKLTTFERIEVKIDHIPTHLIVFQA